MQDLCAQYIAAAYIVICRGFTGTSHIVESEQKYVTGFTEFCIFDSLFPKIGRGFLISPQHCTRIPMLIHGRD